MYLPSYGFSQVQGTFGCDNSSVGGLDYFSMTTVDSGNSTTDVFSYAASTYGHSRMYDVITLLAYGDNSCTNLWSGWTFPLNTCVSYNTTISGPGSNMITEDRRKGTITVKQYTNVGCKAADFTTEVSNSAGMPLFKPSPKKRLSENSCIFENLDVPNFYGSFSFMILRRSRTGHSV